MDFVRRLGGIFRIADRAADDQIIGAAGKGDRRRHRMHLVVIWGPGGPDARSHDQQLSAELLADDVGLHARGDDAVSLALGGHLSPPEHRMGY